MKKKIVSIIMALSFICPGGMYPPAEIRADETATEVTAEIGQDDGQKAEFTLQINVDGDYVITGYEGNAEYLEIPSEYNGRKIAGLGQEVITFNKELKEITLAEGNQFMANSCISECDNLETINLPSTMPEYGFGLGYGPVMYCSSLTKINVAENNKELKSVDGILFSKDMKTIMCYPAGIPDTSYIIPEGIENIHYDCFNSNEYLTEVEMPDTVRRIEHGAFEVCRNLKDINISRNCGYMDQFVFSLTSVETVHIPASVRFMNSATLGSMYKLKTITVSAENNVYYVEGGVLYAKLNDGKCLVKYPSMKDDKTEYSIPDGIAVIEMNAIEYNRYLETVTLPDTITYIGHWNFYNCKNLKSVYMPYSVDTIKPVCFANDNVTIYGYEGSYAEKYVRSFNDETASLQFSSIGSYREVTVKKGETKGLDYSITFPNGWEEIIWSTDNSKVATVKDGIVYGADEGTAIIKGCISTYEMVFKVTVTQPHLTSLKFSKKSVSIYKGRTKGLKVSAGPKDAADTLTFSSSDKKIATVDKNGVVRGKKKGTVTITVKSSNGLKATCKVTVKEKHIKKLKFSRKTLTLKKGKKKRLHVTVNPSGYTDTLKWKTSNRKVATVNSRGMVTAKKKGTVKITVRSSNGKKATCKIVVK